jgi:putative hydrolase
MLAEAKHRGLCALAITDHGPALRGATPSTFFDRLSNPVPGIRLLKGMESNIVNDKGEIDFPVKFLKYADIVLLGIHTNLPAGMPKDHCTSLLLNALDKNPFVDIVTHPEDIAYPIDFDAVASFARERGIALELNNSKILYGRVGAEVTLGFLEACKRNACGIVVDSDAHACGEIGLDSSVRPLLEEVGFPAGLIMNDSAGPAFDFIEERRKIKRAYLADKGSG